MSEQSNLDERWQPGDLALCMDDSGCRPYIKNGERYVVEAVTGEDGLETLTLDGVAQPWLGFRFARSARASHIAAGYVTVPGGEATTEQPRFWTRPNSGKVYDRSLPVGGDGTAAFVAMFYANGTTNPDQEAADAYVAWRNAQQEPPAELAEWIQHYSNGCTPQQALNFAEALIAAGYATGQPQQLEEQA